MSFEELKNVVVQGDVSRLETYISKECNLNVRSESNETLLHYTTAPMMVSFLINLGLDVNAACDDMYTPLHCMAMKRAFKSARLLIDAGANVNRANIYDFTALHLACIYGNYNVVKCLLNAGAQVNERIIYDACMNMSFRTVDILIGSRAEFDFAAILQKVDRRAKRSLHFVKKLKCRFLLALMTRHLIFFHLIGEVNIYLK